jgi:uncharacterized protein (DUF608 family)
VLTLCWKCKVENEQSVLKTRERNSKVDGTTGTPLGGIGTGGVKYCAWTGMLNAFTDMTPAGMQRYNKHVTLGANACFQFFSNRGGTIITSDPLKIQQVNRHYDDDAIFPIHKANYSMINNVLVSMIGFCPWDPVDFGIMCLPYAFYEFTLSNDQKTPVDVAVALRIKFEANPIFIKGKGLADDAGQHMKAVFTKSSDSNPVITAGSDDGFISNGQCNNVIIDTINKVAVKVKLGPKETKTIKFVLAWYKVNSNGKYYYENLYANASNVADAGLIHFDTFKSNAVAFVTKMSNSNIPGWMTNYLLNILCNMVNNTVYTKDGRACMAEGEFNILGTIDEYWQGRSVIGSNLMPEFTWKELEFWGRTQFRAQYSGQIHHDFGVKGFGVEDKDLCAWDDYSHADYRAIEEIVSWPDVNVGFIVGVYETFIATDDHQKLSLLWPYLKNTGSRLIAQKDLYGDPKYPWIFESSHNMYDAGGYCQSYSTGTVIPAYKCMALLAEIMNEPETKQFYERATTETYKGFEAKYLDSEYRYLDKHCEGAMAGPWFSQCLKFDQFDNVKVDKNMYDVLERYYKPVTDSMGFPSGTYDEWPQHLVGHFGGYALQRSKFEPALKLWKDMYNRGYVDRNRVFNLPISLQSKATPNYAATDIDGYLQYTSRTSTWRMYQDIIGYYRNKHSGEIWLEPIILPEMNHRLTDGYFISAEGNGTISCLEKGSTFEDRTIIFKPENEINVTAIYIKDHSGSPIITVNGVSQTWIRTGPEWKKRIKINWNGMVGQNGIVIDITTNAN